MTVQPIYQRVTFHLTLILSNWTDTYWVYQSWTLEGISQFFPSLYSCLSYSILLKSYSTWRLFSRLETRVTQKYSTIVSRSSRRVWLGPSNKVLFFQDFESFQYNVTNQMLFFIKLLATVVEGDRNALFSIATTPRCRGGRYSYPWIAPLYPWYLSYNAECEARRYQVPFLKSLVWPDLWLNPGLLDQWRTLYPLSQWTGIFSLYKIIKAFIS